ncbi:MAG: 4Fe-4S dicluster domain-containing protein [Pseudomonadota bacterium]
MDRRKFFKLSGCIASSSLLGSCGKEWENSKQITKNRKEPGKNYNAKLIDTVRCVGCRSCEEACNAENNLPKPEKPFDDESVFENYRRLNAERYTVVNSFNDENADAGRYTVKISCNHCTTPACASACIVNALYKDKSGAVAYDPWKCIGCRYCQIACPFQIPAYEFSNPLTPKVKKCTLCYPRTRQAGEIPACAEACPAEAIKYGPRAELLIEAKQRIKDEPELYINYVYGEKEVGGTSVLYLAGTEFKNLKFPAFGNTPIPELTEKIQHGIFKFFVPPAALFATLGAIMLFTKKKNDKKNNEED